MDKKKPKKDRAEDYDFILKVREAFKNDSEAVKDMYAEMIEDLEFGNGDQWPAAIKALREADKRPCLRINKIPQFVDKVMGDLRQNRPAIKVRPVDSKSDPDTADMIGGLIRNIEVQSEAETVYDSTGEATIRCGYGVQRVITDYESDDSFDQVIRVERVPNQFSVFFDATAQKWDKSDARRAFIVNDMPRSEFEERYKDAGPHDFDADVSDLAGWITEKTVRVCQYFEKEPELQKLYLLQIEGHKEPVTARRLPDDDVPYKIIDEREVESNKINWYRLTGKTVLEGPVEIPGEYIPLIPCYGKETIINGQPFYNGVIRYAKDPMRIYNYERSNDVEAGALAPKAPWIMTQKMLGPYKSLWAESNNRSFPYLLYKPDPEAPTAKPERNIPQITNQALLNRITIADQELHDTTGLQLASLGKKSNEQSGKAIQARAEEGDVGNFTYADNLRRTIQQTAKVILGMIPKVYDTARVLRIIGEDGEPDEAAVNGASPKKDTDKVFDLTVGKYDLVVSTGPSYKTQRQEELAAMIEFMGILNDQQRSVTADLIADAADWHGADKLSKRLRKLLPEGMAEQEGEPEEPKPQSQEEIEMKALTMAKLHTEQETAEIERDIKKAELKEKKAKAAAAEASASLKESEATRDAAGYKRPTAVK